VQEVQEEKKMMHEPFNYMTWVRPENMGTLTRALIGVEVPFTARPIHGNRGDRTWCIYMYHDDVNKVPMLYRNLIIHD
jgi:hypothetical protein